jgi:peptidoglycan/LPS O-acetylase OafA/YrhL
MVNPQPHRSQRLVWLEGIRIFAVIGLLLYHAQVVFTGSPYTPQPTGLLDNWQHLLIANQHFQQWGFFFHLISSLVWFGFQFFSVFILLSGFTLVLSLQGKTLETGPFLRQRFARILWPLWTIAWLAYPILWALGTATGRSSYEAWTILVGSTFPLAFAFDGGVLVQTSQSWWFVPLILSLVGGFPWLWTLLQRWGSRNLLVVALFVTLVYRGLAIYWLDSPFPYSLPLAANNGWQPFLLLPASLGTFVLGMGAGHSYCQGRGPAFWQPRQALLLGLLLYSLGFFCQFYRWGWLLTDLLLPSGLVLVGMVGFRALAKSQLMQQMVLGLGGYSYSFFLIHGLVVDHTIHWVIQDSTGLYFLLLPIMIVGTLILAILVEYISPLLQRLVVGLLRDVDYVLCQDPDSPVAAWQPIVGDPVCYRGESGWTIVKVEQLLDEREFWLCQVSNGWKSIWVRQEDLEPEANSPQAFAIRSSPDWPNQSSAFDQ